MSNSGIPEGVNGSILAPQQRSQAWYLLTEASRSVGRKTTWQENLKMKARTLLRGKTATALIRSVERK